MGSTKFKPEPTYIPVSIDGVKVGYAEVRQIREVHHAATAIRVEINVRHGTSIQKYLEEGFSEISITHGSKGDKSE